MSDWLPADRNTCLMLVPVALAASAIYVVTGQAAQTDNAATNPGQNGHDGTRFGSSAEMSALLNLGVKTIETHRASAMRKVGTRSTAGLVKYAIRNHLAEP